MKLSQLSFGSLRLRFLLAILLWVSLGIFGIWFTATQVFSRHIEQSYHEELEVHVRELGRLVQIGADGMPELSRPLSDPRYEVPLSGFYWQVSIPHQTMLRSESMTRGQLDQRVAHSPNIMHRILDGPTGPAITYGMIVPGPGGEEIHVVIATDQSELDDAINSFTVELTVWLASLGALLLATGVAIISFGLRPMSRLGKAITRLREGKSASLEGRYPTEIAPLVQDLNEYIRQNSEMVSRARVQAGNLAHSLRTPLAVLTDEAEQLALREECAASAQVLLTHTEMMQQQIDYQLARARLTVASRLPATRARLPQLLVPILNAMTRLHPGKRFDLEPPDQEISLPVDPVNLSEVLSILLDNAGKWARDKIAITIARAQDGTVIVTIRDDGPGMNEGEIARAFDIGSRFDAQMPGSGLGLAMASEFAQSMNGEIVLEAGSPGLIARLRLKPGPAGELP
ncbi:sensor histidine kinase [Alteraurantiacibacter aestuarii]|uniref:histidine kinase n=1 Tax=Alteraurantiacibacter aestuarii TaxID=650004 RepID=A0A844ZK32_9SPHN|nr:HAMP domain-containing sensor histidine kinase [Alteraurantiacibacter aestuarii]MXO88138.1 sensor histidine kinase [Alteraurantiacibacter aestuarii]